MSALTPSILPRAACPDPVFPAAMAGGLLAAATPAEPESTTTTTVSSLGKDLLLDIFLRLPNLPALVRAALACRTWLGAVRSSPSFRRLFHALHPAPLLGIFLETDGICIPTFVPVRRFDPDVAVSLRRGDFFLTSLPAEGDASRGWLLDDCRGGRALLWNALHGSLAALNPMTWAVDSLPMPPVDFMAETRNFLGFHLLYSDEKPSSFRVVCICADASRVRAAVFSSETWDWAINPWVEIGGNNSLKCKTSTLVGDSVYWPCHGEAHMIRIDATTMDVTTVDLPSQAKVWTHSVDGDGIQSWIPHKAISLGAQVDRITEGFQGDLKVVQVRDGTAYLSRTMMTPSGLLCCWFFSLCLETMELDLLIQGRYDGRGYPYIMAWPPSLVGDEAPELEGSE
ncbi:uncharacterized protein [Triticum aestivum]|uniref:F-box domain-containing protein n=2 Tax=Triticum TaxID=4564 RepID=A0A9R0VVN7_TRITD|nr:uncharacterized protein LOC123084715 [Triticum aestivum]VAH87036.1 unnamed protein product [Triticum turgidum subsp. durum]